MAIDIESLTKSLKNLVEASHRLVNTSSPIIKDLRAHHSFECITVQGYLFIIGIIIAKYDLVLCLTLFQNIIEMVQILHRYM